MLYITKKANASFAAQHLLYGTNSMASKQTQNKTEATKSEKKFEKMSNFLFEGKKNVQ